MKKFYITTAIDYANGAPHLGHAYEKVLADTLARCQRLSGRPVHFLTGLDEHGQKVQQTAAKLGKTPQACCDDIAVLFKALCARLDISNDDYIRTTEPRHKAVVQDILQRLFDQGDIYKADYSGFYSVRQEQFVQEKEKDADGRWPELYGEVITITESNYFFRLSRHQEWLAQHIRTHEDFIQPRFRANQVLEFLKEPINDLCISRPKERLSWGIELPFDRDFVTYVWFDALVNYVTGAGYGTPAFGECWPADVHVIGKDILVPPHAVYWPIMLKAAGIELPRKLLVHGWWLSAGRKVSKTKAEGEEAVVEKTALELAEELGADAFRYFVMREMSVGQDSDYSEALFRTRYEADLANNLGNLVSRTQNMCERYAANHVPASGPAGAPEAELAAAWGEAAAEVRRLCDQYLFNQALERLFGFFKAVNGYCDVRAPWKLAKSTEPADAALLATCLAHMVESLRLGATLLAPFMPSTSRRILAAVGQPEAKAWDDATLAWGATLAGAPLGPREILFPKPPRPEAPAGGGAPAKGQKGGKPAKS